ncbi:MAG: hypothetical protein HC919_03380 [Oscillatoriales cyanobacterium SM2_2_1]|nr:hypothetical protein [Oscillatoriales cyanobacterium SM2_2_1]
MSELNGRSLWLLLTLSIFSPLTCFATEVYSQAESVLKVGEPRSAAILRERQRQRPAIAHIHEHVDDGREASTIYVRNIPVLTVLSLGASEPTTQSPGVKLPSFPARN